MLDSSSALAVAMQIKEQAVASQGGDGDVIPMLHLRRDGVAWAIVALLEEDPATSHRQMADVLAGSPADEAVIITDAYITAPPRPGEHRMVAQRFADGDSDTSECLMGVIVRADGASGQSLVRYHHHGRHVSWDSPEHTSPARGPMVDALRDGFASQGSRPVASPDELAKQHGVTLVVPQLRAPARNDPCPCGSGLKAKRCCWAPTA
jgi:hypothetical protein